MCLALLGRRARADIRCWFQGPHDSLCIQYEQKSGSIKHHAKNVLLIGRHCYRREKKTDFRIKWSASLDLTPTDLAEYVVDVALSGVFFFFFIFRWLLQQRFFSTFVGLPSLAIIVCHLPIQMAAERDGPSWRQVVNNKKHLYACNAYEDSNCGTNVASASSTSSRIPMCDDDETKASGKDTK